jgi:hypothetical protein
MRPSDYPDSDVARRFVSRWTHAAGQQHLVEKIIEDALADKNTHPIGSWARHFQTILEKYATIRMDPAEDPYADIFAWGRERATTESQLVAITILEKTHWISIWNDLDPQPPLKNIQWLVQRALFDSGTSPFLHIVENPERTNQTD